MSVRERFGDLDLLRLLAMVLVVVHDGLSIPLDPPAGSPFYIVVELIGDLGVGIFFFISGYLLKRVYPSIETSQDARIFLSRRAWRIFPLYWVAILVALFLGEFAQEIGSGIGATDLLVHLLGLQMLLSSYISGVAFWFIGAIVICYLWYPILVYRGPSVGRLLLRALVILLLAQAAGTAVGLFGGGMLGYFPIFVLGVATGTTDFLRSDSYRSWRLVLGGLAVPAIVYAYLLYADVGVVKALSLSLPVVPVVEKVGVPLLAVLCFMLLVQETYVLLAPRSPHVLALIATGATASYAVYLFHRSLLAVVASLAGGQQMIVVAVYMACVPALFTACFYLQTATDRLIVQVRPRR